MTFLVALRTTSTTAAAAAAAALFQQRAGPKLSSAATTTRRAFSSMTPTDGGGNGAAGGDNNRTSSSSNHTHKYYTVGVTGASGLIGTALQDELSKKETMHGKPIRFVKLTRGEVSKSGAPVFLEDKSVTSLVWNPKGSSPSEVMDPSALQEMDALIHLSGENISTGLSGPLAPLGIRPWSDAKKKEILDSRTTTTDALAKAISSISGTTTTTTSEKKLDFLVASGVGAYGPNFIGEGVASVDETADISHSEGFLAEVSRQWEAATKPAEESGNRVVHLRNGVVLSTKGGALAKLYPIFFLGGGGIVGSGQQYFPYISGRDMARAMVHILETPTLTGPVNICAPGGCTNAAFTSAMGKVLRRPTMIPFPSFAVSALFGEMGKEVLLGGTRVEPKKLLDSGFKFSHSTVEEAVQSAVDETI